MPEISNKLGQELHPEYPQNGAIDKGLARFANAKGVFRA
jgi:hypothetical protein